MSLNLTCSAEQKNIELSSEKIEHPMRHHRIAVPYAFLNGSKSALISDSDSKRAIGAEFSGENIRVYTTRQPKNGTSIEESWLIDGKIGAVIGSSARLITEKGNKKLPSPDFGKVDFVIEELRATAAKCVAK